MRKMWGTSSHEAESIQGAGSRFAAANKSDRRSFCCRGEFPAAIVFDFFNRIGPTRTSRQVRFFHRSWSRSRHQSANASGREYAPWRGMIGRAGIRLWCSTAMSNFLIGRQVPASASGRATTCALPDRVGPLFRDFAGFEKRAPHRVVSADTRVTSKSTPLTLASHHR